MPSVRDRKRQLGLAQGQALPLPGLGRPLCYTDRVGFVAGVVNSSICLLLLAEEVAAGSLSLELK